MERHRKITVRKRIEYSVVEYVSDVYNGEKLDTKVAINDQHLCCIAGESIALFHAGLVALINKHKI